MNRPDTCIELTAILLQQDPGNLIQGESSQIAIDNPEPRRCSRRATSDIAAWQLMPEACFQTNEKNQLAAYPVKTTVSP